MHGIDGTPPLRRGCGSDATYAALRQRALGLALAHADPLERLAPLCDLLWDALAPNGLSWIGFYLEDPSAPCRPGSGQMLLAARRDKPACSPIGVHGVCGQGLLEEAVRVVEDVALLGADYIACDPRDRSEIVIPIYRASQRWGVLDADSHEQACFGRSDIDGLTGVLRAAGLLERDLPLRIDRIHDTLRRAQDAL
jgi:putative methionine-R-sulfoxide reductase with GAF domain